MPGFRLYLLAAVVVPSALFAAATVPSEFVSTRFSGAEVTPCPACLCAAPTGEVFVGVDLLGSLGKGPGKGRIVRLVDTDQDGTADQHTVFATVDNPRGLISVGTKLYVLHTVIPPDTGKLEAMHVSLFEDQDWDGVADGPGRILVSNVSAPKHNQKRGADHSTNGMRMGIDGWIYVAVGDFGIDGARGSDGTGLIMLGGGVIRFRPDGSELEVYTHGLRNIYDVAIDPRLNIFSRGNTNDGGGWNVRFIHHIQTGEYGYPSLFKNFTGEIIPALGDLGGGSGTGALFFQEPGWPGRFTDVPMMCDWGRSQVVIHRLTPDGASFTQEPEPFIKLHQVTDLDVDASGRLYAGAWEGAGYRGNPGKGFVERIVPKGWTHKAFEPTAGRDDRALVTLLRGASATARFAASRELVGRPGVARAAAAVASDRSAPLDARIAAMFTCKQMAGEKAHPGLSDLAQDDPAVREWAIRALADRKTQLGGLSTELFVAALKDDNPRVRVAAAVALGRIGDASAAPALLACSNPPAPGDAAQIQHATPNPAIILPHVAVKALVDLQAVDACLEAVGGPNTEGAIRALRKMHSVAVVDGLIAKYDSPPAARSGILATLIRLHHREVIYDGSWWWGTRPDTRGPFYKPTAWEGSGKIAAFVTSRWEAGEHRSVIAAHNAETRAGIKGIPAEAEPVAAAKPEEPKVDLTRIAAAKGQVGRMSIEDIILALDKVKGDPKVGEALFTSQGCIACHTTRADQPPKGPFMGQVGSVLSRDQIAESILKPNASISQGFASVAVESKDGRSAVGFVSSRSADEIELRDIAGGVHKFKTRDLKSQKELEVSMMPPGLANALSIEELAALVDYLAGMKE